MRREPVYTIVRNVLVVGLRLLFRWRFIGAEKLPRTGPAIIAANHISFFDPFCHAYLVDRAHRKPRFFAKAELWRNPLVAFLLRGVGAIPVERGTGDTGPVEQAVERLRAGEVTVIYPEATVTHNDDLMPMKAKTGVARVALESGAPVYPVAVWGSQWVVPKGRRTFHRLRRLQMLKVGEPLTFDGLLGQQDDAGARRTATDRIMASLEVLVRDLQALHPDGASVPPFKVRKEKPA